MNITMKKIAELAGVSIGTVSKAFSGSKEISDKTRKKIFKITKENNCYEKFNKQKTLKKAVAIICPELDSEYYSLTVSYLEKKLNSLDILTVISVSNFNAEKESEFLSFYLSDKSIDGVIVLGAKSKITYNGDTPIIALNSCVNTNNVDCINTNFENAVDEAIYLLKKNGHTKIAFIGEPLTTQKYERFAESMRKHNLKVIPEFRIISDKRFETAGFESMEKIYSLKDKPTAIFTAYDYIALGVISSIRSHGDSVPEDFSLIGMDDIPASSQYDISLTSIRSDTEQICDTAIELLLKKIDNKFYKLRQTVSVRSELIIRNSVKSI